jgi:hypothetical protein
LKFGAKPFNWISCNPISFVLLSVSAMSFFSGRLQMLLRTFRSFSCLSIWNSFFTYEIVCVFPLNFESNRRYFILIYLYQSDQFCGISCKTNICPYCGTIKRRVHKKLSNEANSSLSKFGFNERIVNSIISAGRTYEEH